MNVINIPEFTTSNPGAFCDTSDGNHSFIAKMRASGKRRILSIHLHNLYIDGLLERLVGYDIPIFLRGTITGENHQPCIVWNVEGTVPYLAEITYNHKSEFSDQAHTYIRFPEPLKKEGLNINAHCCAEAQ